MHQRTKWLLATLFVGSIAATQAAVTVPSFFSDHMVLQRGIPVAIWGQADPAESVKITFRDQTKQTVADASGDWRVELDPLIAGGPDELVIRGNNKLTLTDVLVGEVWLGSGQSNMDYAAQAKIFEKDTVLADLIAQSYPQIRLLNMAPKGARAWTEATPSTLPRFSAQLLSFAIRLQGELDVPIGVALGARGGTPSGAWLTPDMINANEDCRAMVEAYKQAHPDEAAFVPGQFEGRPARGDILIGGLYEDYIAELAGYGMRGVLWDQGESGIGIKEFERDQHIVMRALIEGWRHAWGIGEFHFLFQQKAPTGSGEGCAWDYTAPMTRLGEPFFDFENFTVEKYTLADRALDHRGNDIILYRKIQDYPNTYMVTGQDLGSGRVPGGHPINKSAYGFRAGDTALNRVYGRTDIAWTAPTYAGYQIEGDSIRIFFNNIGEGLAYRHGETLQGFAIGSAKGYMFWAKAVIDGDTVLVSNPEKVPNPGRVHYAWFSTHPWANLFGKNHLPVVSFQTEDLSNRFVTAPPVTMTCDLIVKPIESSRGAASVSLMADPAGLPNSEVSKVEFFNGSKKIGEVMSAPYVFQWKDAPSGVHSLVAKLTNTTGVTATSGSIRVSIH